MGNAGSVLHARSVSQGAPIEKRATAIYVSPTGNDSAAGTLAAPLKSIQKAVDKCVILNSALLYSLAEYHICCVGLLLEILSTSEVEPML